MSAIAADVITDELGHSTSYTDVHASGAESFFPAASGLATRRHDWHSDGPAVCLMMRCLNTAFR